MRMCVTSVIAIVVPASLLDYRRAGWAQRAASEGQSSAALPAIMLITTPWQELMAGCAAGHILQEAQSQGRRREEGGSRNTTDLK